METTILSRFNTSPFLAHPAQGVPPEGEGVPVANVFPAPYIRSVAHNPDVPVYGSWESDHPALFERIREMQRGGVGILDIMGMA